MKKLVFKDIASYLPYDLAYAFVEQKNAVTLTPKITNQGFLSVSGNQHNINNNVLGMFPEERCYKPILRSLSSLGEEIEQNGVKFTPIIELLKEQYPPYKSDVVDYGSRYNQVSIETNPSNIKAYYTYRANFSVSVSFFWILQEPYHIILKLIEWKFDIGNLIEDGLALDVKDLDFNPYK